MGDNVLIKYNDIGDSIIYKTEERKSYFARLDPDKSNLREQAIAANFDYVFVIVSLNKDFNLRRIERYLALSWQSGAIPVVIFTKADLVDDYDKQVREVEGIAPGVDILVVSAHTGQGLDKINKLLEPQKSAVFLGSSGVGKSSLLNALTGKETMTTAAIREDDSKGRHTTTHRQLIALKSGASVIDTPGMRELGMWEADSGLGEAFADVEAYFERCKFSDCTHQNEPGCAVLEAIKNSELPKARFDNYLKLKTENNYFDNKTDYIRKKNDKFKSINQELRKIKKKK